MTRTQTQPSPTVLCPTKELSGIRTVIVSTWWADTGTITTVRVLTGSIGRATSTQSSLLKWSWDPATSEILKAGGSEHKLPEQLSEKGMRPRERKEILPKHQHSRSNSQARPGHLPGVQSGVDHQVPGIGSCSYFLCTKDSSLQPVSALLFDWAKPSSDSNTMGLFFLLLFCFYFFWVVLGMGEG